MELVCGPLKYQTELFTQRLDCSWSYTLNLAECSNRVTSLLEYLDRTLITCIILYYDLQLGSRSIFDFDHWLLPKISFDRWPVSIYFHYIFVHYLLAKLWLLWKNSLTVILHLKSALSIDLSFWPWLQIIVQWLLEWHPLACSWCSQYNLVALIQFLLNHFKVILL